MEFEAIWMDALNTVIGKSVISAVSINNVLGALPIIYSGLTQEEKMIVTSLHIYPKLAES